MATLAVMAHYDPGGQVAGHVRYALAALRPAVDRLVVVTASSLQPPARTALECADEVIERNNTGYDFFSWRTGLLAAGHWPEFDRIILVNDSFVGPLIPVPDLLADMDASGADAYGITISQQYVSHLQSYFMCFGSGVVRDPFFQAFWYSMPAVDDRERVIDEYELGLARLLGDLGVRQASYFTPSGVEHRIGASRNLRAYAARRPLAAAGYGLVRPPSGVEHRPERGAFSPVHMLWDRALTGALPAVKVAHFTRPFRSVPQLRRDIAALSRMYPEAFAGFGEYVSRMRGPRL